MKRSLYTKLIFAFVVIAITTAVVFVLIMLLTSRNRFNTYLKESASESTAGILEAWYAEHGSWDQVESLNLFHIRGEESGKDGAGMGLGPGRRENRDWAGRTPANQAHVPGDGRTVFTVVDTQGKVLISGDPRLQHGGPLPQDILDIERPLWVDGKQIGTLFTANRSTFYNAVEQRFIRNVGITLAVATMVSLLAAGMTGIFVARSLTKPLQALTTATKKLAAGEAPAPLEVKSKDELGELTKAFNQMSFDLEKSVELRRQMTADVAHDLRTPLTVIGGYVEAIRDGDLPVSAERMDLISAEIAHLNKLVADLRTISQADAGELELHYQELALDELLEKSLRLFELQAQQSEIDLSIEASSGLFVWGDETRLLQVMENLLSNALRHTPKGGEVKIGSREEGEKVLIWVRDSGSGIGPEELDMIFERFHRGDKSRHNETSQSGLGLAISRAIINGHEGRIWAESQPGEGMQIWIALNKLSKE